MTEKPIQPNEQPPKRDDFERKDQPSRIPEPDSGEEATSVPHPGPNWPKPPKKQRTS